MSTLLLPILLVLVAGGLLLGPMLRVSARADRWEADSLPPGQGASERGGVGHSAVTGHAASAGDPVRRPRSAPYDWNRDLPLWALLIRADIEGLPETKEAR